MRIRVFGIMILLFIGLAVSGCIEPSEKTPVDQTALPTTTATPVVTPAPTGDVTDAELSTIDSDMTEIEDLLAELDDVQDLSFNELEGLNF